MSLAQALRSQEEVLRKRKLKVLQQWSSRYKELLQYIAHRNRGYVVSSLYSLLRALLELAVLSTFLDNKIADHYLSWIVVSLLLQSEKEALQFVTRVHILEGRLINSFVLKKIHVTVSLLVYLGFLYSIIDKNELVMTSLFIFLPKILPEILSFNQFLRSLPVLARRRLPVVPLDIFLNNVIFFVLMSAVFFLPENPLILATGYLVAAGLYRWKDYHIQEKALDKVKVDQASEELVHKEMPGGNKILKTSFIVLTKLIPPLGPLLFSKESSWQIPTALILYEGVAGAIVERPFKSLSVDFLNALRDEGLNRFHALMSSAFRLSLLFMVILVSMLYLWHQSPGYFSVIWLLGSLFYRVYLQALLMAGAESSTGQTTVYLGILQLALIVALVPLELTQYLAPGFAMMTWSSLALAVFLKKNPLSSLALIADQMRLKKFKSLEYGQRDFFVLHSSMKHFFKGQNKDLHYVKIILRKSFKNNEKMGALLARMRNKTRINDLIIGIDSNSLMLVVGECSDEKSQAGLYKRLLLSFSFEIEDIIFYKNVRDFFGAITGEEIPETRDGLFGYYTKEDVLRPADIMNVWVQGENGYWQSLDGSADFRKQSFFNNKISKYNQSSFVLKFKIETDRNGSSYLPLVISPGVMAFVELKVISMSRDALDKALKTLVVKWLESPKASEDSATFIPLMNNHLIEVLGLRYGGGHASVK